MADEANYTYLVAAYLRVSSIAVALYEYVDSYRLGEEALTQLPTFSQLC